MKTSPPDHRPSAHFDQLHGLAMAARTRVHWGHWSLPQVPSIPSGANHGDDAVYADGDVDVYIDFPGHDK